MRCLHVLFVVLLLLILSERNSGAEMSSSPEVKIGNFFPSSASGIAFIKNDSTAFLIHVAEGKEFIPDVAAPDDSFHRVRFKNYPLELEWGRVGMVVVAKLATSAPDKVPADLRLGKDSWPGFVADYSPLPEGAKGSASFQGINVDWNFRILSDFTRGSDPAKMTVHVALGKPVYFVAGFDEKLDYRAEQIDEILKKAAAAYEEKRVGAQGDWGNFLGAIADNLNNTRLYGSDNKLIAHTVTRAWVPRGQANASPYFCWDSFFNGLLASLDDPVTARNTIRAVLGGITPEGFVPNFSHWNMERKVVSSNRSQPPVGAMCVWKMHQYQPDLNFLREVYPKLVGWHDWWMKARDGNHDGLLEWGGDIPLFECGWDDSPHWEGTRKIGNSLNANAVDLNSLYVADAQYLAKIADALGLQKEAEAYRSESLEMSKRINENLWNEELGIYCSRFWDNDGKTGAFLTRITPMNFYPLIAGIPDQARAQKVLAIMTDPKKFWRDWILPTVAYDDPLYPQQAYWRGKVWAPVNYLVFQGLKRYGSSEQIAEFGRKSVGLFMRNWEQSRVCGENYLSTTGEQQAPRSDPHYTWGALLCLTGLESLVDLDDQDQIQMTGGITQNLEINNLPVAGRKVKVTFTNGQAKVTTISN